MERKVNPQIQEAIDKRVLELREDREPSGRISAGRLGQPLQWQILHYFKVPAKPFDAYTLRKFQRGKDVEDRIVEWLNPTQKQEEVKYRDVIGYVDAVIDGIPVEIKSVTNMAFKYIQKEGSKRSHKLQAELYAKALGVDKYQIAYVASDDYRVLTFEEKVGDEVDKIIDRYEKQVEKGFIPIFEAEEPWQAKADYNNYPEWMKLTQEEINEKFKKLTK